MKILALADIHIGSIKDPDYVYNTLTEIIDTEVLCKQIDMVIILGDYFDRLAKVNEDMVSTAINVMSYLIRTCIKNHVRIRIVYGTESHEMDQYRLFAYHFSDPNLDIRLFKTVESETFDDGTKILYVPEEYIDDKDAHYAEYFKDHYNYVFGHGTIDDGMPAQASFGHVKTNEKHTPRFKSGEFAQISDLTVFGHYHVYTEMPGNVFYLGSLFRSSFGEEDPKGYGVIDGSKLTFIENRYAYVYKTYTFEPTSDVYNDPKNIIDQIRQIKEDNKDIFDGAKQGKIRLLFNAPSNLDQTFKETLHDVLVDDKQIATLIKHTDTDAIAEIKSSIDPEYDYLLDPSLPIADKIHRWVMQLHDVDLSMDLLKKYIEK